MESTHAVMRSVDNPAIDRVAEPLSRAVRAAFDSAGAGGKQAKNALHGVWLGHPLHPVFTDVPIGAWTTALALDAAANGDPGMRRAATFGLGLHPWLPRADWAPSRRSFRRLPSGTTLRRRR